MHPHDSDTAIYDEPAEPSFSVRRYAHILQAYAPAILLTLAVVAVAYAIIAIALYLLAPSSRIASQQFRLDFAGAAENQYPNSAKFSPNDITTAPILTVVYEANGLSRFITFRDFARSIYVVESNPAYDRLVAEYRSRLNDPKLQPVDRERIEKEYAAKRDAIRKNEYALNFLLSGLRIPDEVARKTLGDVLREWARWTAENRGGLLYKVTVLSPSIVDSIVVDPTNLVATMHMLRSKLPQIRSNVMDLETLPGVELIRAADGKGIEDIRVRVEELQRFRVEPLSTLVESSHLVGNRERAIQFIETQLDYETRKLRMSQQRADAIRDALIAYAAPRQVPDGRRNVPAPGAEPADPRAPQNAETVMPQLSESFLERMLDLSNAAADRTYRQSLTEQLHAASMSAIPAAEAVQYEAGVLERVRSGPSATSAPPAEQVVREIEAIKAEIRSLIGSMGQIHALVSRNLHPATQLYTLTAPASITVARAAAASRLILWGVLVLLVTAILAIAGALLHNRLVEEESATPAPPGSSD